MMVDRARIIARSQALGRFVLKLDREQVSLGLFQVPGKNVPQRQQEFGFPASFRVEGNMAKELSGCGLCPGFHHRNPMISVPAI